MDIFYRTRKNKLFITISYLFIRIPESIIENRKDTCKKHEEDNINIVNSCHWYFFSFDSQCKLNPHSWNIHTATGTQRTGTYIMSTKNSSVQFEYRYVMRNPHFITAIFVIELIWFIYLFKQYKLHRHLLQARQFMHLCFVKKSLLRILFWIFEFYMGQRWCIMSDLNIRLTLSRVVSSIISSLIKCLNKLPK